MLKMWGLGVSAYSAVSAIPNMYRAGPCLLLWWAEQLNLARTQKRMKEDGTCTREQGKRHTDQPWCISALPLNENWLNYTIIDLVASSPKVFFC